MLDQNSIAGTVITLSLDAALNFYSDVGLLKYKNEFSQFFKNIVISATEQYSSRHIGVLPSHGIETYDIIANSLASELDQKSDTQTIFLKNWFWNAFSGVHCSDISLSFWQRLLLKGSIPIDDKDCSQQEYALIAQLFDEFKTQKKYLSFMDKTNKAIDEAYLTEYDRKVLKLYRLDFNDDLYNPFIMIDTLYISHFTREFIKTSKTLKDASFPFEKLHDATIKYFKSANLWGAEFISDIRTVKQFHRREDRCPK